MENAPEKPISRVLDILKSRVYRVPAYRLQEMELLARHTTVYRLRKTPETQNITAYDYNRHPVGSVSIRSVPQVIDAPPIFQDGKRIDISPALVLVENASDWTLLHEICHLLSIGPYLPLEENRFYHYFGIREFSYKLRNGKLERVTSGGHNGTNELLTDYAAWHFMRLLCGDALPFYFSTERFGRYAEALFQGDASPETLIGWYFSGNASAVSEFLLGGGYADYESLCRALCE